MQLDSNQTVSGKPGAIHSKTHLHSFTRHPTLFTGGVSNSSGLTLHPIVLEKVLLGHGHQLAVAWVIRTHYVDDGLVDVLIMALAVGAEFVFGLGWTGN